MEKHKVVMITSPESNIKKAEDTYVKEVECITKNGWKVYHIERISSFNVYVFFKKQT
ncbi:MAG: hypothetical protein GY793_10210 [Proteobacteria bacterium]|nr:hypothetical protein [Pseudomonadota bacterium]